MSQEFFVSSKQQESPCQLGSDADLFPCLCLVEAVKHHDVEAVTCYIGKIYKFKGAPTAVGREMVREVPSPALLPVKLTLKYLTND